MTRADDKLDGLFFTGRIIGVAAGIIVGSRAVVAAEERESVRISARARAVNFFMFFLPFFFDRKSGIHFLAKVDLLKS